MSALGRSVHRREIKKPPKPAAPEFRKMAEDIAEGLIPDRFGFQHKHNYTDAEDRELIIAAEARRLERDATAKRREANREAKAKAAEEKKIAGMTAAQRREEYGPLIDMRRDMFKHAQTLLADAYRKAGLRPEGADRGKLVKALGMLGSDHAGERENAIAQVERMRAGRQWDDLLI